MDNVSIETNQSNTKNISHFVIKFKIKNQKHLKIDWNLKLKTDLKVTTIWLIMKTHFLSRRAVHQQLCGYRR